ncbi:MAG: hypothetical protein PVG03_01105 [Desulfarculaceae bacterium]
MEMVNVAGDFAALRRMAKAAKGARTVSVIQFGGETKEEFDPDYYRVIMEESV